MKLSKLPASFTVFVIFFGISLLEAFRTRNWINVAFWIGIAIMFLIADGFKPRKKEPTKFNKQTQEG